VNKQVANDRPFLVSTPTRAHVLHGHPGHIQVIARLTVSDVRGAESGHAGDQHGHTRRERRTVYDPVHREVLLPFATSTDHTCASACWMHQRAAVQGEGRGLTWSIKR